MGGRPTSMVHGRGAAQIARPPGFSRDKVRARNYIPSGRSEGILKIHTQKTQEMVDIDGPRERTLIVEVR